MMTHRPSGDENVGMSTSETRKLLFSASISRQVLASNTLALVNLDAESLWSGHPASQSSDIYGQTRLALIALNPMA